MKKEEYLQKAIAVHGNKYDYSLLPDEVSTKQKYDFICPLHGIFNQKAGNHIYGKHTECPECGKLRGANKQTTHGVGEMFENEYGKYEIIKRIYGKRAIVRFLETRTEVEDTICNIRNLRVKDHSNPIILGVGYIGKRRNSNVAISKNKAYRTWHNMLLRCYSIENQKLHPTYSDCYVCKEWHNFSVFEQWYNENCIDDFYLDKDILFKGNKEYAPEKCCFVPNEINVLFTKRQNCRGLLPIGVVYTESKKKYKVSFSRDGKRFYVGCYDTPEAAFQAYKKAKEEWIKELANKWKDKLKPNVYEALMNYQVEITD